jgi:hypothetical protein
MGTTEGKSNILTWQRRVGNPTHTPHPMGYPQYLSVLHDEAWAVGVWRGYCHIRSVVHGEMVIKDWTADGKRRSVDSAGS